MGRKSDVSWLIFDVFVWAQLELQLGIVCAAAPALRVFFRDFVKGPLARAAQSAQSRTSYRSDRYSIHSTPSIRRVGGPNDHAQRSDFSAKHVSKESWDHTTVAETEVNSMSPVTAKSGEWPLIRTPQDYEVYSLQNMERYRPQVARPERTLFSDPGHGCRYV